MRQAGARLAGVVVKLHQAEDEVRGHQLEPVRGIGDDIPAGGRWRRCVRGLQSTREVRLGRRHRPTHSPLGALALRVEVRVSETVDAEAEHVVGLQGLAEEVAIATAILPETEREGGRASIGEKKIK